MTNLTNLISLERQYYDEVARHEEAIVRLEPVVGKELVSCPGDFVRADSAGGIGVAPTKGLG